MTVPEERTEAVLRTRKFLRDLYDAELTPRVPLRVRQRAMSLLKHLPTGGDLALAAKARPDVFAVPAESRVMAGTRFAEDAASVEGPAVSVGEEYPADSKTRHIAAADGNVFEDIEFSAQEAKAHLADSNAHSPDAPLEPVKTCDSRALFESLMPMTADEIQAMSALD